MEPPQAHRDRLIADDLTAFRSALSNKRLNRRARRSRGRPLQAAGRGLRILRKAADIEPMKVEEWLAGKRKDAKKKKGMSVQTSNHYLRAIKQFTRWLGRHKRLRTDPLIHLEMLNVAVDRRHDRRALSDDEVSRILAAAKNGGDVLGFSPADRHMLYVMALSTGLRASELASLRPESLLLLEDPPTVTVKAGVLETAEDGRAAATVRNPGDGAAMAHQQAGWSTAVAGGTGRSIATPGKSCKSICSRPRSIMWTPTACSLTSTPCVIPSSPTWEGTACRWSLPRNWHDTLRRC
jgi:hypothetical protein